MANAKSLQARSVRVDVPEDASAGLRTVAEILRRQVSERCGFDKLTTKFIPIQSGSMSRGGAQILSKNEPVLTITLGTDSSLPSEGYRIEDGEPEAVRILGAEELGVLYGVGKFLRTCRFDKDSLTPGTWRGASSPKCHLRAVYLASHFNNIYEAAPIEEIVRYIQDLGLWGYNTIYVHYPFWQFNGIADPDAQEWLERFKTIFVATKKYGMRIGITQTANGCYKNTPAEFLRTDVPGHLRGNFGVNLCPSKPEARAFHLANYDELLDQFKDIGVDYAKFGPYDEGGCACSDCWPWGARGFLSLAREMAEHARTRFPNCRIVLGTWGFENEDDNNPDGEWVGLAKALSEDSSWVDYIMADGHCDYFPGYLLEHGMPADLPLVNFPEISMFNMHPWGGYGANPAPAHFQMLWDRIKHMDDGGSPYSEGIYEDINKAIIAGFYWDPERKAEETVAEYLSYEFTPDAVEDLLEVVRIFEENHNCHAYSPDPDQIGESAIRACEIVERIEKQLTPQTRQSWRWRVFYLRALIDREMHDRDGKLEGEALKDAFDELTRIYHAENAHSMPIAPPQLK